MALERTILCRVELFGRLQVRRGDENLTKFATRKVASLLAYLAFHRKTSHTRDRLVDLFWPDMDLDTGRDNLSTTLSSLRRQLEPTPLPRGSILVADRSGVSLRSETVHTDVAAFDTLLAQARRSTVPAERSGLLADAVALYRGDLLDGNYEDWALQAQTTYRHLFVETLTDWSEAQQATGDLENALNAARHAVQIDPYEERAYIAQIQIAVMRGHRSEALEVYRSLVALLREELDTEPSTALQSFVKRTLGNAVATGSASKLQPVTFAPPATVVAMAPEPKPVPTPPPVAYPPLPLQLTRFWGREAERDQLLRWLSPHAEATTPSRLVTVTGPGGAGKTRLTIEVGKQLLTSYADRVWFVPLADLRDPAQIPAALAKALAVPTLPGAEPLHQVLQFLGTTPQSAPALLILDNLEQLLSATPAQDNLTMADVTTETLRNLLEQAPCLSCLVTSRVTLRLGGEQELQLGPLPLPAPEASPQRMLDYSGIALYNDRAVATKPDFAITANNAGAVAELCQKLEGMPLAIEMAAAWVKTLPPARMLERIGAQLDLMVSRRRDLPARHQTLRATVEWSYDLLTPELQALFAGLSVFRGGWQLEAAEAVCGPKALFGIAELQDHSLVITTHPATTERYRMLEPLREFAWERLEASPAAVREAHLRAHVRYFLDFATECNALVGTPQQQQGFDALEQEHDNLRCAFDTCLEQDVTAGLALASALFRFWQYRGYLREGSARLRAILCHPAASEPTLHRAKALNGAGILALLQADYACAWEYHQESCEISHGMGERSIEAVALHGLANVAFFDQRYEEARGYLVNCLELRRALKDEMGLAATLHTLGTLEMRTKRFEVARDYLEQALVLRRQRGEDTAYASTLAALGQLLRTMGDIDTAERYFCDVLPIFVRMRVPWNIALCLSDLMNIAMARGQTERAVCLHGAVTALREEVNYRVPPKEQSDQQAQLQAWRTQLGDRAFEHALATGAAMRLEEAVAFALQSGESVFIQPEPARRDL